jgi:hypothetical protein
MAHTCHHRYAHQTHLDSITSLITCPIYVTPFGSFHRRYCFCFCALFVFLVFVLQCVDLLKHSLPELASRLSAHIVTVKLTPRASRLTMLPWSYAIGPFTLACPRPVQIYIGHGKHKIQNVAPGAPLSIWSTESHLTSDTI